MGILNWLNNRKEKRRRDLKIRIRIDASGRMDSIIHYPAGIHRNHCMMGAVSQMIEVWRLAINGSDVRVGLGGLGDS